MHLGFVQAFKVFRIPFVAFPMFRLPMEPGSVPVAMIIEEIELVQTSEWGGQKINEIKIK